MHKQVFENNLSCLLSNKAKIIVLYHPFIGALPFSPAHEHLFILRLAIAVFQIRFKPGSHVPNLIPICVELKGHCHKDVCASLARRT